MSELRLGGHKKARLHVQPGFFRDPVGIRTPNLRIRSAMLYPVELQGPFRHDQSQSGGKDRQASFPSKRPLVKTRKKKKSAPAGSLALPRIHRIADADPPGPSVTAHRRSIPLPKLRNQRRLRSAAGPPGEFATALPCHRSRMGQLELFSVTSQDRLAAVRLPVSPFGGLGGQVSPSGWAARGP